MSDPQTTKDALIERLRDENCELRKCLKISGKLNYKLIAEVLRKKP